MDMTKSSQLVSAFYGCVDGSIQKITWLFIGSTNNDPLLIALYYLKLGKENRVVVLRLFGADCGKENSVIGWIQRFF